ncbi:MAG: methyltransferase domain-containing protein [Erysipelotrichaceae bacterium]|nr:methyltransferase domain-containing protein [Erysipelotrichaceae bacterium]MBQ6217401.1 methyltransferase domain-containing protein [Erysipelotrichaceae bacterium]
MKSDYLKYIDLPFDQEGSRYKVNSDTVALGMFLDPMKGKSVLDIGTNTGALLLYAHQKGAAFLHGVDIHEDALKKAEENLKEYSSDYKLYKSRIQDLEIDPVDVIVCNPPFFEMNNVTDDIYMKEAMFEESLPLDELFKSFRRCMKANGEVYLIYQADRFPELYDMCKTYKLKIMKMAFVHDVSSLHALRVLAKLKIGPMSKVKVLKPILIDKGSFLEY